MACAHHEEVEPADGTVVAFARDGDAAAFALLVDRHHGPLLRYLRYRTGDPELAADLAQDAFLDAFRRLGTLRGDHAFAAWLYRIAQNRLRMAERRRRLRRVVSFDWLSAPAAASPALRLPAADEGCHERDLLGRVLAELSPPLREALLLHSLDGFTAPEVARILGVSPAAAQRRISRAKERFRARYRALEEEGRR